MCFYIYCLLIVSLPLAISNFSAVKLLPVELDLLFEREGLKEVSKVYKETINRGHYEFMTFEAEAEITHYARKIGYLMDNLKKSLHRVISWMEEEVAKYAWNTNLTDSQVKYVKLRELASDDERLVDSRHYPFKILSGQSGIHIPVEVYTGDPSVFHTIKWTSAMDQIVSNQTDLNFTYFASRSGIFRVFPAFPWDEVDVDLFDIRQTPWYSQGATIPKDLMVLIDTSGSMTGLSLKIANVSAQRMIGNLDENDYFVVTHFHETDKKGPLSLVTLNQSLCFKSFVRATKRNKHRVFNELSTLNAKGYAQFDQSLAEAFRMFEELNNSTHAGRGADQCHQILVVLTDDAFSFDQKTVEVLKNKPPNIKVLVYSLGDPVNLGDLYEREVCKHQGHYKYLPTTGVVSNLMKDYIEQSTLIARGSDDSPIRTDVLLHGAKDLFQTSRYNGSGLMISLSMPVYNRTNHYQFMGLMGTNVPIDRLMAELPLEKFGPLGYAFGVNPNGNVLFHPGLRQSIGHLDDPPILDWLDLEFDANGTKKEVRRKMIDNLSGSEKVKGFVKVGDRVHTYEATRNYIFTGLPQTNFGLAFVTPDYHYEYVGTEESDDSLLSLWDEVLNEIKSEDLDHIRLLFPAPKKARELATSFREIVLPSTLEPLITTTTTTTTTTVPPPQVTETSEDTFSFSLEDIFGSFGRRYVRNVMSDQEILSDVTTLNVSEVRCSENITEDCSFKGRKLNNSLLDEIVGNSSGQDPITPLTTSQLSTDSAATNTPSGTQITTTTTPTGSNASTSTSTPKPVYLIVNNFLGAIRNTQRALPPHLKRVLVDLLVAVLDSGSSSLSKPPAYPVRSRVVMLSSGLAWITPPNITEQFENELRQQPVSPILQRVYDSDEKYTFWIPIKPGEPELKKPVNETQMGDCEMCQPPNENENLMNDVAPANETSLNETVSLEEPAEQEETIAVSVFQLLSIPRIHGPFRAGVIGITLEPDYIHKRLLEVPECADSSMTVCYLLEDAANIVAVNNASLEFQVGRFLGYMDPPLMHALLHSGIYQSLKDYDYQATCEASDKPRDSKSTGHRLQADRIGFATVTIVMFAYDHWSRFGGWHLHWWSPASLGTLLLTDAAFVHANQKPYSCIKAMHLYYAVKSSTADQTFEGTLNCSIECQRSWMIHDISDTNLKLLIADRPCGECGELDEKLPRDPVEDDGPDVCAEVEDPRYRRVTTKCWEPFEDETTTQCSSCQVKFCIFSILNLLFWKFTCSYL